MIPANAFTLTPTYAPFKPPLDEPYTPLSQVTLGGVAVGDGSQGRTLKRWVCYYDGINIQVRPEDGTSVYNVPAVGAESISLAFDANMGVVLAWKTSTGAKLYYYDTVTVRYITRDFPGLTSCRVSVDDTRDFYTSSSDVIFCYTKDGNLYYRQQRDRYDTERLIQAVSGTVVKAGMNELNRFQIELTQTTFSATYKEQVLSDTPVFYSRLGDVSGTVAVSEVGPNGTYSGGVTLNQPGFVASSKAVVFNASASGKVNTNYVTNHSAGCTIECWFNASSTGHDANSFMISKVQYYADGWNDFPISVAWDPVNSKVLLRLSKGDSFTVTSTLSSTVLTPNTDYHLAAVYRPNGNCEIFINGALVASTVINFSIPGTFYPWTIGTPTENGGGIGNGSFNGKIGEVAIYDKALSASRILRHYESRTT